MDDLNKEEYKPKRNSDGTYIKGYSGCPGGGLKRLSEGQKVIREFAISRLPDILQRTEAMWKSDYISEELRYTILKDMKIRAGGKPEEAPIVDDKGDAIATMSTQKAAVMLEELLKREKGKDDGS